MGTTTSKAVQTPDLALKSSEPTIPAKSQPPRLPGNRALLRGQGEPSQGADGAPHRSLYQARFQAGDRVPNEYVPPNSAPQVGLTEMYFTPAAGSVFRAGNRVPQSVAMGLKRLPVQQVPIQARLDAIDFTIATRGGRDLAGSATAGQAKLRIGQADDPFEREADAIADRIVHGSDISGATPLHQSTTTVRRQPEVDEEEQERLQTKGGIEGEAPTAVQEGLERNRGQGSALSSSTLAGMEESFGVDFSDVRVHTDSNAESMNRELNARAFTHGSDIYFNANEYSPETSEGKHLLAHELTHVVQQTGSIGPTLAPLIQRTSHSGTTPTNCHNWKIPLPPWIAGTIAHGQISSRLGIPPAGIPRATKLLMGIPNPPAITPMGFADLYQHNPASIGIAEIKPTKTGDGPARAEAAHYVLRHLEWLTRAPWTGDTTDLAYLGRVGGPFTGSILDLSSRTGSDLNLGMFWGDPLKQLHMEADSLGSVVYWCTGAGLPGSPVWYPVFRRLINEIKDLLNQAKRALQGAVEGITAAAASAWATIRGWIGDIVDWGMANSRVLAFLLLLLICLVAIVVLFISILAELPSGGTSTVPAVGSVAALAGAAAGMLVLLGIDAPDLPSASATVAMAAMPDAADAAASGADYERDTGTGSFPASPVAAAAARPDPAAGFLAALAPIRDPIAILHAVSAGFQAIPPGGMRQLGNGIDLLERNGDSATASFLRAQLAANGLA